MEKIRKKRATHSVDPAVIAEESRMAKGKANYQFAVTLNELLEERGISQEQIAHDLGLSTSMISSYRHGKTEPRLSVILDIATYLDIDCHYLMTGTKAENLTASKDIGLSDSTLDKLKRLKHSLANQDGEFFDFLNRISNNNDFFWVLQRMLEFEDAIEAECVLLSQFHKLSTTGSNFDKKTMSNTTKELIESGSLRSGVRRMIAMKQEITSMADSDSYIGDYVSMGFVDMVGMCKYMVNESVINYMNSVEKKIKALESQLGYKTEK